MIDKKKKALERVQAEIDKIDSKKTKVYFFVLDTKGIASGSLEYIYKLAKISQAHGYDTGMLYQLEKGDEFEGVEEWLGKEYADIPHYNVSKEEVEITPSDVVFIPEIFAGVMNQTKKLPCKRVAILQNFNYLTEQVPYAAQWGDFGILDCITNEEYNKKLLHGIFPYVKTTVIPPYIDKMFSPSIEPQKLVINVVASDQTNINKIIKPFYWKYPTFKWVSFRDLRGYTKEVFAERLREGAITVWVDDDTSFGYSALEAMKSGSIVIAKIPNNNVAWVNGENEGSLNNCCVWFDNYDKVHKQIATVVRSWMTDNIPEELEKCAKETASRYTEEKTDEAFATYLGNVFESRKRELQNILDEQGEDNAD